MAAAARPLALVVERSTNVLPALMGIIRALELAKPVLVLAKLVLLLIDVLHKEY